MTADREALVAEVAGVVTTASPGTPTLTALKIADALADLLAAREQQARAEAKVAGYVLAVTDAHNRDGCGCGGECFRLDPIRKRIEADT